MFKQTYELARLVIISSLRRNIILASFLIMLPLILAAWLFEISNTGFQSGFILDAGSGLMTLFAVLLLGVLGFEHLFWVNEQPTPWFLFSRIRSRIIFPLGKFCGISLVLISVLIVFALLLSLLIYLTSGSFILSPFRVAFIVWAEYSVFLSVFIFFSTFLSRLMTVGMIIPFVFIANSASFLKTFFPNWLGELLLIVIPDAGIFEAVIETEEIFSLFLVLAYSIFISLFYITLAGFVLRKKDL
jgi:hypothetical protein